MDSVMQQPVTPTREVKEFFKPDEETSSSSWKLWILFLALTLLLHGLLFLFHLDWAVPQKKPAPVEIHQVDPAKLEAIKNQWKQKRLLLGRDNAPSDKSPPPNAKYESDRNTRVEKETLARQTQVIPEPGTSPFDQKARMGSRAPTHQRSQAAKRSAKAEAKSLLKPQSQPLLDRIGIPMQLTQNNPEESNQPLAGDPQDSAGTAEQTMKRGGDQAIFDKTLPQGSQNLLNSQESVYYSFYSRLYRTIGPIWEKKLRGVGLGHRLLPGEYVTSVDVVLDQSGYILAVNQIQSSGIPEFDRVVHQSWRNGLRFQNPPKGLLNSENQVHTGWSFTVQVHDGAQFNYLPPERTY